MKRLLLIPFLILAMGRLIAQDCHADFKYVYETSSKLKFEAFGKVEDTSGHNEIQWNWGFGDPASGDHNTDMGKVVSHEFSSPGTYDVTLIMNVSNTCSDSVVKHVFIDSVNHAPVAINDYATIEGDDKIIYVLKNDYDKDGMLAPETLTILSGPAHGTAEVVSKGAIKYVVNEGFSGDDSLQYTVNDHEGATSNVATVYIKVINKEDCEISFRYEVDTSGTGVYFIAKAGDKFVNFFWDFGDGNTSTDKNPFHKYVQKGIYKVCLKASDSAHQCQSTECKEVKLGDDDGDDCEVNFKFEIDSSGTGVYFIAHTSDNIVNFHWNFGDSTTSNDKNPFHQYANKGEYKVCLTGSDSSGHCKETKCQVVKLGDKEHEPCKASFKAQQGDKKDSLGFAYYFHNTSSGNPEKFYWTFGDGSTSTDENPVHYYKEPGEYKVCLKIAGPDCQNMFCQSIVVKGEKNPVHGVVFYDKNENGSRDDKEPGIADMIVEIQPGNILVNTKKSGEFKARLGEGTYTVKLHVPQNWTQTVPQSPDFYTINIEKGKPVDKLVFGIAPDSSIQDLRIHLAPYKKRAKPGNNLKYQVRYQNLGGQSMNGSVTMTYDSQLDFINAEPKPTSINDSTFTLSWDFSNLAPSEVRRMHVIFKVPHETEAGDTITSVARIEPLAGDQNPANNESASSIIIGEKFRPAIASAQSMSIANGAEGDFAELPKEEAIKYVVRFENGLETTANNLIVIDELDSRFDISTLNLIDASHEYDVEIVNGNTLQWTFTNMNLPNIYQNEEAAQGFISFSLKLKDDVPAGSLIKNSAVLYFETAAGEQTEVVESRVTSSTGVEVRKTATMDVVAYPNPVSSEVTFRIDNYNNQPYAFRLLDITGREVKVIENISHASFTLQNENWNTGFYFFELRSSDGSKAGGKLIIQ